MGRIIILTIVAAALAIGLAVFLNRRIAPDRFRQMKWVIVGSSALTWGLLIVLLTVFYWDNYYTYIKPAWAQWGMAPLAALFYALLGLLFWALAARLSSAPTLVFCLLGGLWSIPEHLSAIYQLRILETVPMLRDVSPLSVLVFAFFEYALYWVIVLGLAHIVWRWWPGNRRTPATELPKDA